MKKATSAILRSDDEPIRSAKLPTSVYKIMTRFGLVGSKNLCTFLSEQETALLGVNQRADANHRYTTSIAIRDQMVARGSVAEGYGPNAVALCGLP